MYKTKKLFILTLSSLAISLNILIAASKPDKNFHIYLCFGQSNMTGLGEVTPADKKAGKQFKVFRPKPGPMLHGVTGKWEPGVPPLCVNGKGVGPADIFARTLKENKIGVIVIAIAGADIRAFDKDNYGKHINKRPFIKKAADKYGGNPYQHMIELAKLAQKDGVIKGILLHQGESNNSNQGWSNWVNKIYNDIHKDLSLKGKKLPLLVGELVSKDQNGRCANHNKTINKLHSVISNAHVVSSTGCTPKEDRLHFNTEGIHKLGKRYGMKMLEVQKKK